MNRLFILIAMAISTAITLPPLLERTIEVTSSAQDDTRPETRTAAEPSKTSAASYTGNRGVVLTADSQGHFQGTFRINGRNVDGLIDTGASVIAINRTTARRLGLDPKASDYKYPVSTANGVVNAAHVVLKRVELDSIRVKNVDALVLSDKSLAGTLIGMSFLKKLKSYKAGDGEMVLTAH